MLALNALPLALCLAILSSPAAAAPCNSPAKRDASPTSSTAAATSSAAAAAAFVIPIACESTCASLPTLYSLDSCTVESCSNYCAVDGLDAYVDCSNCVLQQSSPPLSKKQYREIQAGLIHMVQVCSAANAAAAPDVNLIDWYTLNTTTATAPAGSDSTGKSTPAVVLPSATASDEGAGVAPSAIVAATSGAGARLASPVGALAAVAGLVAFFW